ncbi:MAG: formimidoylglutamase [Bdellovibrionales bacterium]
MKALKPTPLELFFSSADSTDPRMGQMARPGQVAEVAAQHWYLLGYPDDEGIRLNHGRPGASLAPNVIRHHLYRMTPDLLQPHAQPIHDLGNLPLDLPLAERHKWAGELAALVFKKGGRWLALGGGHDYGYADGLGFLSHFQQTDVRPLLINFDSHLDVRPIDKGFNSGTPFRRLLEEFSNFDLIEIGMQSQCNAKAHLEWLKARGGHILTLNDILKSESSPRASIQKFLLPHCNANRPTWISFDMDAFASAYAPGCSQSWATGLTPNDVLPTLDFICEKNQVYGLGVYETSPPFDVDDRTSRLAALLIHRLIHASRPLI